jgi:murein DD-endopeptidase MepM/ murein hydrolase activator NlpD
LPVELGDFVSKGDVIGYYYDDFGGNATTFHLHFELIAFINGSAQYVSPYASFIAAEQRSKNMHCTDLG